MNPTRHLWALLFFLIEISVSLLTLYWFLLAGLFWRIFGPLLMCVWVSFGVYMGLFGRIYGSF